MNNNPVILIGSDYEDDKKKKKRSRNKNVERRRRAELSSDFQSLRSLIPGLKTTDRVTTRVILDEATNYCRSLTAEEEQHKVDLVSLKKQQKMLRKQITILQRQNRKNAVVNYWILLLFSFQFTFLCF